MTENKKQLYELINPRDAITFYAEDDAIAQVAAILVGSGICGIQDAADPERTLPPTMFLFGKELTPQELEQIRTTIITRPDAILFALQTFAVAEPGEREIYDEYTTNGTNEERVAKWDDKKRTSLTNYCGYARSLCINDDGRWDSSFGED